MITLNDLITSSGKYPEREKSPELTDEVRNNLNKLCKTVNDLLAELGWNKKIKISSGFRPSNVNAQIKNAAKKSLHMTGLAVDIEDNGELAKTIMSKPELLKKHGLWLEHPDFTKGWCHLDLSFSRADRAVRVFKP